MSWFSLETVFLVLLTVHIQSFQMLSKVQLVQVSFNKLCRANEFRLKSTLHLTPLDDRNNPKNTEDDLKHMSLMAKHNLLSIAAAILNVPAEIFTTPPMLDPYPPKEEHQIHRRNRTSDYLEKCYDIQANYYFISKEEENFVNELMQSNQSGRLPSTYGEITSLGARQLFSYMKLRTDMTIDTSKHPRDEYEILRPFEFVDLGCGHGKLLLQAYLELPDVNSFLGIELAPTRYEHAEHMWKVQKRQATILRHDISSAIDANFQLLQGDLFHLDISCSSHLYVASLCFTDEMMDRLAQKLIEEGKDLKCIATLKPFPSKYNTSLLREDMEEPSCHYVEMSWTKPRGQGCLVYFYHL